MPMTPDGRATALLGVISKTPNWGKLSPDEQNSTYQTLLALFGQADLGYIVGNATVLPSTMQAPGGATVATTGGPAAQSGTVTSPSPVLSGTGKLS